MTTPRGPHGLLIGALDQGGQPFGEVAGMAAPILEICPPGEGMHLLSRCGGSQATTTFRPDPAHPSLVAGALALGWGAKKLYERRGRRSPVYPSDATPSSPEA